MFACDRLVCPTSFGFADIECSPGVLASCSSAQAYADLFESPQVRRGRERQRDSGHLGEVLWRDGDPASEIVNAVEDNACRLDGGRRELRASLTPTGMSVNLERRCRLSL
jgi:hypothetical protein